MRKNTLLIISILVVAAGGFFLFNRSTEAPTIETSGMSGGTGSAMPVPGFEGTVDEMIVTEDPGEEDTPSAGSADTEPAVHTVAYSAGGFSPATITITMGEAIRFVSTDGSPLWVASDPHPVHTDFSAFDQKAAGNEYLFTFTKPGTYRYHNHRHAAHEGIVIVK